MKHQEDFILIKYRQQIIVHDWVESKRLESYFNADYTAIKAANMLEAIVKLLQLEQKGGYPSLPREIVAELATDVGKISLAISDIPDYDGLNVKQLYLLNNLIFSFYLFKHMFAKKKKLEEVKDMFGFAAARRPMYGLLNN